MLRICAKILRAHRAHSVSSSMLREFRKFFALCVCAHAAKSPQSTGASALYTKCCETLTRFIGTQLFGTKFKFKKNLISTALTIARIHSHAHCVSMPARACQFLAIFLHSALVAISAMRAIDRAISAVSFYSARLSLSDGALYFSSFFWISLYSSPLYLYLYRSISYA